MNYNHEEKSNLVFFFTEISRVTTLIMSKIFDSLSFASLHNNIYEIVIELLRNGNTICYKDKNTGNKHEVLDVLVVCFNLLKHPDKISSLNKLGDFTIQISTFDMIELNHGIFFLHVSIAFYIRSFLLF
jgi:hypothetical protein